MIFLSPFCEYGLHDMCRGKAKAGDCKCWCHNVRKESGDERC